LWRFHVSFYKVDIPSEQLRLILCRFVHAYPIPDDGPQSLSLSITGTTFGDSRVDLDTSFFDNPILASSMTGYAGGGALFVRLFIVHVLSSSFVGNLARTSPFLRSDSGFNSIFSNGGALLFNENAKGSSKRHSITSCNFSKNVASGAGSAIFAEVGATLTLSHSSLTANYALGGTLVSSGFIEIVSSVFNENTAIFLASDILITCASPVCGTRFSSLTITSSEVSDYAAQARVARARLGSGPNGHDFVGNSTNTGENIPCTIPIMSVRGNGYTPGIFSTNAKVFDLRNSKQRCTLQNFNDMFITIIDSQTSGGLIDIDFSCSVGQYPHASSSIGAGLSRVTLNQSATRLFQYPSYQSSTDLNPYSTVQLLCRQCPPQTFQGINLLSYSDRSRSNLMTDPDIFCKRCPSGADCGNVASLRVIQGLYLWSAMNASNFNISVKAERMPTGYGNAERTPSQ
jgi:hypothetical protein